MNYRDGGIDEKEHTVKERDRCAKWEKCTPDCCDHIVRLKTRIKELQESMREDLRLATLHPPVKEAHDD